MTRTVQDLQAELTAAREATKTATAAGAVALAAQGRLRAAHILGQLITARNMEARAAARTGRTDQRADPFVENTAADRAEAGREEATASLIVGPWPTA